MVFCSLLRRIFNCKAFKSWVSVAHISRQHVLCWRVFRTFRATDCRQITYYIVHMWTLCGAYGRIFCRTCIYDIPKALKLNWRYVWIKTYNYNMHILANYDIHAYSCMYHIVLQGFSKKFSSIGTCILIFYILISHRF